MEPTTFVGLDVRKRMTSVAIAEAGRGGEVRFVGEIPSTPEALGRLVERLKGRHRQRRFYRGVRGWTKAYRRWLTTVHFDHPAQQIVLQDDLHAIEDAEARLERLERQITELLPSWSMAPVVEAVDPLQRADAARFGGPGGRGDRIGFARH